MIIIYERRACESMLFSYAEMKQEKNFVKEIVMQMDEKQKGVLLIPMPEEVDQCSAVEIRNDADYKIMKEGYRDIIFDFSKTSFMDSSGIGIILGRYRLVHVVGGGIYIVNASPRIQKIIHAAGLDRIVTFIN